MAVPATRPRVRQDQADAGPARRRRRRTVAAATATADQVTVAVGDKPTRKRSKNPKPILLDGEKAVNPHFTLDQRLWLTADRKADQEDVYLVEVLRQGIKDYADGASEGELLHGQPGTSPTLPPQGVAGLAQTWNEGPSRVNAYMAALYEVGWPLRTIAEAMAETGAGREFTRQAVDQRIQKAPADLPADLPPVPVARRRAEPLPKQYQRSFSFRVLEYDYDRANRRAAYRGDMLSVILEDTLRRYLAGEVTVTVPGRTADR